MSSASAIRIVKVRAQWDPQPLSYGSSRESKRIWGPGRPNAPFRRQDLLIDSFPSLYLVGVLNTPLGLIYEWHLSTATPTSPHLPANTRPNKKIPLARDAESELEILPDTRVCATWVTQVHRRCDDSYLPVILPLHRLFPRHWPILPGPRKLQQLSASKPLPPVASRRKKGSQPQRCLLTNRIGRPTRMARGPAITVSGHPNDAGTSRRAR
ncbi:hypothetical protein N656DRAFT_437848 [Canariomyces notabilis]|uniref:Uncharacterized protein n=1 Tax=Canariomyces notabilis TaxID=2074819 RepID=A0AAN6QDQ5_9PEZI|nr:hypothetical protein N656DRAFT_437848 [Canariomyces arenarius]